MAVKVLKKWGVQLVRRRMEKNQLWHGVDAMVDEQPGDKEKSVARWWKRIAVRWWKEINSPVIKIWQPSDWKKMALFPLKNSLALSAFFFLAPL